VKRLIIFDCDGVLIDSEAISARMLIAELGRLGVVIDLPYVARHFLGRSYPTVMETIRRDFRLDLPPSFEEAYRARLLAAFERELTAMPHVQHTLESLSLPYCIATSSSPRRATYSLRLAGLEHLAGGGLFTASMVERGKPAPDLFLHVAREMGVAPADCLVIEDSLTGVRAALAAGMEVWRFVGGSHLAGRDLEEPEDARANRRFASFADFFAMDPEVSAKP
jgi:HAD superfamily hydrolase (TIGR01509 family)